MADAKPTLTAHSRGWTPPCWPPGGLGVVEASLTGLLVLAEVDSSQAVLATLAYRIASYWVPLLAGPVAYGLFRTRYRKR